MQTQKALNNTSCKAKGIKEGNIIYLKDATGSQLASVFGNDKSFKGKLFNYIKPKKSNVYIYYAGHGAPGEEGDAYLSAHRH